MNENIELKKQNEVLVKEIIDYLQFRCDVYKDSVGQGAAERIGELSFCILELKKKYTPPKN